MERNCPVCGSADKRDLFADHNRRENIARLRGTLSACSACGMRYLSSIQKEKDWKDEYEAIEPHDAYARYDYAKTPFRKLTDAARRALNMRVDSYVPAKGGDLLDVGCSDGAKLELYAGKFRVYGVDFNSKAIAQAKAHSAFGEWECGELSETTFGGRTFDYVRMDNVLEHVDDLAPFIRKVHSRLKPGGEFFGYVPNGRAASLALLGKYSLQSWVPFHVNLFTASALGRLLEANGFSDFRAVTTNAPLLLWQSLKQAASAGKPVDMGIAAHDAAASVALIPAGLAFSLLGMGEEIFFRAKKAAVA